jgi:hypothetical protein
MINYYYYYYCCRQNEKELRGEIDKYYLKKWGEKK